MIRVSQIKLPIFSAGKDRKEELRLLKREAAKKLRIRPEGIRKLKILRRSVDARKKENILYVYILDLRLHDSITGPSRETEAAFVRRLSDRDVTVETEIPVRVERLSPEQIAAFEEKAGRPVVVGSGPCGLFAAHTLCLMGLRPLILERGEAVEKRMETVERFFQTGSLRENSNVQFGEGGAGTFSDGKLNTSIKGQGSRIRYVLEQFYRCGAPEEILYDQKPHIGTDILREVVKNLRQEILAMGGSFLFETRLTGIETEGGALSAIHLELPGDHGAFLEAERSLSIKAAPGETVKLPCSSLILAIGHSARDTFRMLCEAGVPMEQKPFAMGLRVQHPQRLIDKALYGEDRLSEKEAVLGPASYKLTHRLPEGRGIYSFCMCPGGYVINASSEKNRLCVNGMSRHGRSGDNANAALIVTVGTEDFPGREPLSGMELQEKLEEQAYSLCGGAIPCETYGDFLRGKKADFSAPSFTPSFQGYYAYGDLRSILPEFLQEAVICGMEAFGRNIRGFDWEEALFSGVETRTSSPVRILRDGSFESGISGIFPAGEGAGYAGGITSAAIDGMRTAEALAARVLGLQEQEGQE